jgi:hypothetical protein
MGASRATAHAERVGMMNSTIDLRASSRAVALTLPASPELTSRALAAWRGRMTNEHGSRRVFEALADDLDRARMIGSSECRAFAAEERRHGVLCGAVVEALGGEASFIEPALDYPDHADVAPREGVIRNVLSIACMSETIAVSLIGAERLAMPEGPLRDVLETILADEVGHARFGWKLVSETLPRMDRGARERLNAYLAVAFAHVEQHELAHISDDEGAGEAGAALGLCHGRAMRQLFYATVTDVIIPRLNALGLSADVAWARRHEARSALEELTAS